jgi:hypothetical protein
MLTTPQAALIMKVTLSGEVSEEAIAHISKITFSGDSMKVFDGADFALDSIVKIEFYEGDTGATFVKGSKADHGGPQATDHMLIRHTGSVLHLQLPEPRDLEVFLCSLSGQTVTRVFDGHAQGGDLRLPLQEHNLASTVYNVVVKAGSELYVKKSVHVKGGQR